MRLVYPRLSILCHKTEGERYLKLLDDQLLTDAPLQACQFGEHLPVATRPVSG